MTLEPGDFDLGDLKDAFQLFTSVSKRLENSYSQLETQSKVLKRELGEKNLKLIASLEEKERLEGFLEGILQNLPVGILVVDLKGLIRLANEKAKELLRQGDSELQGRLYTSFDILEDIALQGDASYEKRKGRSVYRCTVSSLNGVPDDDPGWVIMIEDISKMTRWKALIERQKRLSSMGEMAARIAHEIRNPLGSMELNIGLLLEELEESNSLYPLAFRLSSGMTTVTQILSNLLHFAKGTNPHWELLELGGVVAEAVEFAYPILREKDIEVKGNFKEARFKLIGDKVLLRQALLNLILNAVEVMDKKGLLKIIIELEEESAEIWNRPQIIKVFVQDKGKGIPEEDLDRIFDPFFTTKSRGTGLGLAIVNNIVESHKGIIEVESRPGEGSNFILSLPCRQREVSYGYTTYSSS